MDGRVETVEEEDSEFEGSSYTGESESGSSFTGSSYTGSSYTGSGTGTQSGSASASAASRTRSRSSRSSQASPLAPIPREEPSIRSGSASSRTRSRSSRGGSGAGGSAAPLAPIPREESSRDDSGTRTSSEGETSFASGSYSGGEASDTGDDTLDLTVEQEDSIVSNRYDNDNSTEQDGYNDSVDEEEGEETSTYESTLNTNAGQAATLFPRDSSNNNNRCKSIAVLGTMSDAGKSTIAAGLCRILTNGGLRVAPFKAQNMSNNASPALLPDKDKRKALYEAFSRAVGSNKQQRPPKDMAYGEIGTAQALQAEACRQVPRVEMNPVLLKSGGKNKKGEYLCSVVVLGQQVVRETYGALGKRTTSLRQMVMEAHEVLVQSTGAEAIVIEGAGSCTELNLMDRDIVNLPLVRSLNCPWLLVANIDPGGVFAQIIGTKMCVSEQDWSLCVGIVINKLRGEPKYFEPGPKMLQEMAGKPVFVVPFLNDLNLPEEDGLGIERRLAWESSGPTAADKAKEGLPLVIVVAYPHTAIADDICPLERDSRFRVQWRRRRIPTRTHPHVAAIILPGSRLTRLDLKWLNDSGWADYIRKHAAAGGSVLGLCGGYQMLGWTIDDPLAVEGAAGSKQGLGLLPIDTTIAPAECKVVSPRRGQLFPSMVDVEGFELHCGQSRILEQVNGTRIKQQIHPLLTFDDGRPEGMCSGRVKGTYLHGILRSPEARVELLVPHKDKFPELKHEEKDPIDRFAEHLESCGLDFATVIELMLN